MRRKSVAVSQKLESPRTLANPQQPPINPLQTLAEEAQTKVKGRLSTGSTLKTLRVVPVPMTNQHTSDFTLRQSLPPVPLIGHLPTIIEETKTEHDDFSELTHMMIPTSSPLKSKESKL